MGIAPGSANSANGRKVENHKVLIHDNFSKLILVADAMGQGQPACQGEWKMCRKKK